MFGRTFWVSVVVVAALAPLAWSQTQPSWLMGFDLPTIGWVRYDKDGAIRGTWGINLGLGVSSRTFTAKDGLQPERLNFFWGWGTVGLIIPYLELGVTYPLPIDTDKLFCISAGGAVVLGGFFWHLIGYPFPSWWIYPVPLVGLSFWLP